MDENAIRLLIADHLGVDPARAEDSADFQADLGADSLDLVELPMLLEHRLGIIIADEESELCATVGDALRLVREKLAAPAIAIFS
jgi:acyl carrier protein